MSSLGSAGPGPGPGPPPQPCALQLPEGPAAPRRRPGPTTRPRKRRPSVQPDGAALLVRVARNGAAKDEADDGCELHHDVQRRARGVLQGVANGVARDGVLVRLGALHVLLPQAAGGDVLLGVVPGTAGVAHGDG